MGFESRHRERDLQLPVQREKLLKNALQDLADDPYVEAIFEGGSLARGDFDRYSDIDLHVIVAPHMKTKYIEEKRSRAEKWGNVLFFEESSPTSPVIVTHYDCFVKVDSWYQAADDYQPSIWLQGLKIYFDKKGVITKRFEKSEKIVYKPTKQEVERWRGKVLAFVHETYRAAMREEFYYAISNLDRVRWLIAYGWYMEMGRHLNSSYGVWSKIEGDRSQLDKGQLADLASWDCGRNQHDIMTTVKKIVPEFYRVNKVLSDELEMDSDEEKCRKIIEMVL
ncbi:nucleotidyltransferase domain-containing protein [Sporosarcina sp. ACRSL]|uniref:nucleotidyltransferase domain-containing protein n=1 Tax=Sporosarcina sp. ACRSL TaxID=2918215 RepID=UPI001EF58BFC|nr:nucleotidyltransferase domain-containing protein [Sporosarcina sp. ACRSL]